MDPGTRIFVAGLDSQATITLEQTAAPERQLLLARFHSWNWLGPRPARANGRVGEWVQTGTTTPFRRAPDRLRHRPTE